MGRENGSQIPADVAGSGRSYGAAAPRKGVLLTTSLRETQDLGGNRSRVTESIWIDGFWAAGLAIAFPCGVLCVFLCSVRWAGESILPCVALDERTGVKLSWSDSNRLEGRSFFPERGEPLGMWCPCQTARPPCPSGPRPWAWRGRCVQRGHSVLPCAPGSRTKLRLLCINFVHHRFSLPSNLPEGVRS